MIEPGEYIRRRLYSARGRRYRIHRGDSHRNGLLLSGEYIKTKDRTQARIIMTSPEVLALYFGDAGGVIGSITREQETS